MKKYFLTLLFFISTLEAAAPGTHVFFAQLWTERNALAVPNQENAFIAGTLFPDIRYLGTLKRDSTHEKNVTAAKIRKTPNNFKAGMRLHVYVDDQREDFVKKSKIESLLKDISKDTRVLFLKMLEDEILWDRVETGVALIAMEGIYQEELDSEAGEQAILEWHRQMTRCFSRRPSELLKTLAEANKGFLKADKVTVKEWSKIMPQYAKDPRFIAYTENMVAYVSDEF